MEPIDDITFSEEIKPIFDLVFASEDPYGAPFRENIQPRLLLYWYTYGLYGEEPWLKPVTDAIKEMHEEGFYLTLLGRPGKSYHHWYVPLEEAALYVDQIFPLENAIYSTTGKWGVICSDEDHAVAGGPEEFISIIRSSISDWEDRLHKFLELWKGFHDQNQKLNIHWLPVLLTHIYGLETAKNLLLASHLEWLINEMK